MNSGSGSSRRAPISDSTAEVALTPRQPGPQLHQPLDRGLEQLGVQRHAARRQRRPVGTTGGFVFQVTHVDLGLGLGRHPQPDGARVSNRAPSRPPRAGARRSRRRRSPRGAGAGRRWPAWASCHRSRAGAAASASRARAAAACPAPATRGRGPAPAASSPPRSRRHPWPGGPGTSASAWRRSPRSRGSSSASGSVRRARCSTAPRSRASSAGSGLSDDRSGTGPPGQATPPTTRGQLDVMGVTRPLDKRRSTRSTSSWRANMNTCSRAACSSGSRRRGSLVLVPRELAQPRRCRPRASSAGARAR